VLELRSVDRVFRGRAEGARVAGLDLRVAAGEIVALVGLNGAGKTTLMRLALGMLRPDAGAVLLGGSPLAHAPRELWRRVGHLVDTPLAYPELTTHENLRAAAELHGADPACADASLHTWHLERWARQRTRRLSLGNRQRVGLAAALQHEPDLVILDEPSNALDPAGVIVLRDELLRRARAGAAVLVSSHHLDEVARIADRIVLMNRGTLIGELDPATAELERVFFERVRRDDLRTDRLDVAFAGARDGVAP
jgi:ABC-2 type transport system ATP-binding protein